MSTHAAIIIQDGPSDFRGIYCHFDGYIEGVGRMLLEHYKTRAEVDELIKLGAIASLSDDIQSTRAYHRDRGEKISITTSCCCLRDVESRIDHGGYVYVFTLDGQWRITARTTYNTDPNNLPLLSDQKEFKQS